MAPLSRLGSHSLRSLAGEFSYMSTVQLCMRCCSWPRSDGSPSDPMSVWCRRSLFRFNGLFLPPRSNEYSCSPEVCESCATWIGIVTIESGLADVSLRGDRRVGRDSRNFGVSQHHNPTSAPAAVCRCGVCFGPGRAIGTSGRARPAVGGRPEIT